MFIIQFSKYLMYASILSIFYNVELCVTGMFTALGIILMVRFNRIYNENKKKRQVQYFINNFKEEPRNEL